MSKRCSLAEDRFSPIPGLLDWMDEIVNEDLWHKGAFPSFSEFATAPPQTGGLGVRSLGPAKLLRFALMELAHLAEWTDVMTAIMREPGRPKTHANGEGFRRFYKVGTSMNCQDRVLLTLRRGHPEIFATVCSRECTIAEGAIRAGLKAGSNRSHRPFDLLAFVTLGPEAQVRLISNLFSALSAEARPKFITEVLERELGEGLAEKWRQCRRPPTGT